MYQGHRVKVKIARENRNTVVTEYRHLWVVYLWLMGSLVSVSCYLCHGGSVFVDVCLFVCPLAGLCEKFLNSKTKVFWIPQMTTELKPRLKLDLIVPVGLICSLLIKRVFVEFVFNNELLVNSSSLAALLRNVCDI